MSFTLPVVSTGYNLSILNSNFSSITSQFNTVCLYSSGGQNVMGQNLDLNGYNLLNVGNIGGGSTGLLTQALGDARYILQNGGVLQSSLNASNYTVTNLAAPVNATDAVRNEDLQAEATARNTAVTNLQAQIVGSQMPASSQFSPISWHVQQISASISIPTNVNAWSFGPSITIAEGQTVTIGEGSFWTIADGALAT
jgi:hypothetical protein